MSWAITATAGMYALSAIDQSNQASAGAAYSKKQAKWNDKQNLMRARSQGEALDTNLVRSRTEVSVAMDAIESSEKEAVASAKVAQAAAGMGAGSYDTVLNTFARKRNQAEGNTLAQLVASLVQDKMQRKSIAAQATSGMSTGTQSAPSALSFALRGAGDFFTQTYGVRGGFDLGGGGNASPGITSWNSGPGINLGGDVFKGVLDLG